MPRPEVLQKYYADYYKSAQEKNTCPNAARFADHIAAHTSFLNGDRPIRILDFGGGDGTLARKIADRLLRDSTKRADIDLVDYEKPGDYGTNRIRVRGYRTLQEAQGPYDLVIASAVLEHIPEVHPVLRQLFALMRPAGYFYARTPYVVPFARLFRNLDFTYPGHVHDLGSAFWNRVGKTFELNARCIISGPSLVETTLTSHPARTVLAAVLKAPARVEEFFSKRGRLDRWWNFVGGWEIMLQSAEIQ
jgi:2-polyprenyl-3-methyl-5-hydroxy-6-metoxy-1,4-benzoquinol methylase